MRKSAPGRQLRRKMMVAARPTAIALAAATTVQAFDPATGPDRYAAPSTRVAIARGRRLHIRCEGAGSPTIILTAGAGGWGWDWRAIQPSLARTNRVCAWDRAGTGFSDPSGEPQDSAHTTADLAALLRTARIAPPYLLAGHSMGSFETLTYAFRHSDRVVGIVLVDPSGPSQIKRFTAASPKATAFMGQALEAQTAAMAACVVSERKDATRSLPDHCTPAVPEGASPALKRAFAAMAARPGAVEDAISLLRNFSVSAAQVDAARRPLGRMPLVILTAGRPMPLPPGLADEAPRIAQAWSGMHADMARYSDAGVRRIVPDAGHYIQLDRPAAVVAAIYDMLAAARARTGGRQQN